MKNKRAAAAILFAVTTLTAHAETPKLPDNFEGSGCCESQERSRQQDTPHPSINICRGMTDDECAAEMKRAKRNYAYASRIQPPPQHYIDHYEPQSTCQPSQLITREDAWRAWAGASAGPSGMDCVTVFVPVYR